MNLRVQHIVYCTLVMPCGEADDCRRVELEMGQRGFHPRGATIRSERSCMYRFVREHGSGTVEDLRAQACSLVTTVAGTRAGAWRGYVQVCGSEGAWATLAAGKPPLLGRIEKT